MPGPRILVVRFSALGDVVLITPLLRALRRTFPDASVTVVTRRRYAEVLETHPGVNRVVGREAGEPIGHLVKRLAGERYDIALDLQGSLASRVLRARVPASWGVAPKARRARLQLVWTGRATQPPLSAVRRYFAAGRGLGIEPDGQPPDIRLTQDDRRAAEFVPTGSVVLAPGAAWANKRWPPERWRSLAGMLQADGLTVVSLGSESERGLLQGADIIPAFGLPLRVAAGVLGRARAAVVHDSGAMHLAVAVRTPVAALFGPTTPALGLVPEGARVRVLERPLACRPCTPIGSEDCPLGHHRCMMDLEPRAAVAAVKSL
ncbi:MAG TPA: glycosyltransferase family 9 protein [Gemmatimonadales bacterium]|nr:glycosyltransferase family 9 protein [Gemmatimonadales bacterium]